MALRSPTPEHSFWGVFATAADLPNVAASPTQDPALEAGDRAWVTSTAQLFGCVHECLQCRALRDSTRNGLDG